MPSVSSTMYRVLLATLFASTLVASGAIAQVAGPDPARLTGGPQTFDGIVALYLLNEFGDVEGIVARDGTQVRFPPHMGADLVRTLKPGDRFVAQGDGTAGRGVRAYALGVRDGALLTEARPSGTVPPPLPREARAAALASMEVDGTIATVLVSPRGEVDGVVLSDDTIVRFPPRGLRTDTTALRVGRHLSARGYGTRNAYGHALRAEALGLDGQEPAALQPPGPTMPVPPVRPAPPRPAID